MPQMILFFPQSRLPRLPVQPRWGRWLTLFAAAGALAAGNAAHAQDIKLPVEAARRSELITLVRQDCGSCHGLTLKGGLGPALLPINLKDKPESYLKTVILHGMPDTAMPPWQRFLSDAEAQWIVSNLKEGFPREP
jgi:cytochrome c55X